MIAILYELNPAHVYSTRYNVFSISIFSLTQSWSVGYSTVHVQYFGSCSSTPLSQYPSQSPSFISSSPSGEEMEGEIPMRWQDVSEFGLLISSQLDHLY